MKKTLNENNNIINNSWKPVVLIFISTLIGGFVLIFSLLKSIENTQQIKVDPFVNANQLSKKRIEVSSVDGDFSFDVYIADDNESRATGLMNVESMPSNEGMLFIFPESENLSFWMKNTYIPLDIIFFDSDMRLINYHENAEPLNESTRYKSDKPAKYVLELNSGTSEELKLDTSSSFKIID